MLTDEEKETLEKLVKTGGKGYRVRHAQILLKLDSVPENEDYTYDFIRKAYNCCYETIADCAKRFVYEGLEAALGRKDHHNHFRKVTGDVEARIVAIACSDAPGGRSRWTCQLIADELISLKVVDYITDTTICDVLKKTNLSHGRLKNGVSRQQGRNLQQKWKMCLTFISVRMTSNFLSFALTKRTSKWLRKPACRVNPVNWSALILNMSVTAWLMCL
jgi:hypothetical protein